MPDGHGVQGPRNPCALPTLVPLLHSLTHLLLRSDRITSLTVPSKVNSMKFPCVSNTKPICPLWKMLNSLIFLKSLGHIIFKPIRFCCPLSNIPVRVLTLDSGAGLVIAVSVWRSKLTQYFSSYVTQRQYYPEEKRLLLTEGGLARHSWGGCARGSEDHPRSSALHGSL